MITSTQIMWTCLPNGVVAGSSPLTVKVSLVVTPQLNCNPNGTPNQIGGTVFEKWPAYVRSIANAGGFVVQFDSNDKAMSGAATLVDHLSLSPAFNVDAEPLWEAIFPASTPALQVQSATSTPDFKIHSYDAGRVAEAIRAAHEYVVHSHATHGKLVLTGSDPYSALLAEHQKAKAVLPKMIATARGVSSGPTHEVLKHAYRAETGDLGVGYELMRHAMFYDPGSRRASSDAAAVNHAALNHKVFNTHDAPAPSLSNDFNTLHAHLGGQPQLMRKLGLIIDLEVPVPQALAKHLLPAGAIPQSHVIWLSTKALPLTAGVTPINPATKVDMTLALFRASLSTDNPNPVTTNSGGSINNGFLPLGDTNQYSIYTEDTEGTPFKLDATSAGAAGSSATDPTTTFPALRTAGMAIALTGRETVLTGLLGQQAKFKQNTWIVTNPSAVEYAAEDVARGYAVEIAEGPPGTPLQFQSLCLRDSQVYVPGLAKVPGYPATGPFSFVLSDEGYTKATSATSPGTQAPPGPNGTTPAPIATGTTELDLHPALFGWEGWSLAAQRPGRAITAATPPGDIVQTETPLQPVNTQAATFPSCQITVRARAGSLTRLRFGQYYTLRARVLDLAGNDMSVSSAGAPEASGISNVSQSPTIHYLRYEPVPNPVLILQSPLTEGEHLENLVIRSNPYGPTPQNASDYAAAAAASTTLNPMNTYYAASARWIAPPKGAWAQAEALGAFDSLYFNPMSAALGTDLQTPNVVVPGQPYLARTSQSAASFLALKAQLFQCSQKEAGLFTDANVWNSDPHAPQNPSPNPVKIITPPTAQNLPPPTNPGQPLAAGQYNILKNNGTPVYLPYLPDANAQGLALQQVVEPLDAQGNVIVAAIPTKWLPVGFKATRTYAPRTSCTWPEIDMPQFVLQDSTTAPPGTPSVPSIVYGSSTTANPSGLDAAPPGASTPGQLPPGFTPTKSNMPITFYLAPGAQYAIAYGSTVANPNLMQSSAAAGGANSLQPYAPFRILSMVHAVQQPKPPALLTGATQICQVGNRQAGDTSVTITGGFVVDGITSQSVDLTAAWADIADVQLGAGVSQFSDGTNRCYVVKSGRLQEWTLQPTQTSIAYPSGGVSIVQQFGDTKTRQVFYQATATSRFREYFPQSLQANAYNFQNALPAGAFTDSTLLLTNGGTRIPSTARPSPPKILYVVPTYQWATTGANATSFTTKTTTNTRAGRGLRVFVDRPWYTTGDTEELGVVVNPLGPVVPSLAKYVSQWGKDPIRNPQADILPAVLDQTQVMGGSATGTLNTAVPLTENGTPVTVLSFPPTAYDPTRQLWYFDLEFAEAAVEAPFVRLALTRFQPNSLGCAAFPNTTSGDLRMSTVVLADMVKLSADRTAAYLVNNNGTVTITVSGVVYASASWNPTTTAKLGATTANDLASQGRMVYAQLQEASPSLTNPGEFDWYPIGNPVNLTPFQMAGSLGNSTSLSYMATIPKPPVGKAPAGITVGAKHQLLITEHEVFYTDQAAAFPGTLTPSPLGFPSGAMQMMSGTGNISTNTTSRIVFSDVLPLSY